MYAFAFDSATSPLRRCSGLRQPEDGTDIGLGCEEAFEEACEQAFQGRVVQLRRSPPDPDWPDAITAAVETVNGQVWRGHWPYIFRSFPRHTLGVDLALDNFMRSLALHHFEAGELLAAIRAL